MILVKVHIGKYQGQLWSLLKVKLALQKFMVLNSSSESAKFDGEVRFSDFGGVMIHFY